MRCQTSELSAVMSAQRVGSNKGLETVMVSTHAGPPGVEAVQGFQVVNNPKGSL